MFARSKERFYFFNILHPMVYTPKVRDAINFAIRIHELDQKQKRTGKDVPYLVHPFGVGLILLGAGADEDVVVAGILHDTIEDSTEANRVTPDHIRERFGPRVADIVFEVTLETASLSWEDRKQHVLHTVRSYSHDALLVHAAGLINTAAELADDYAREGVRIFDHYPVTGTELMIHGIENIEIMLENWPENPLAADLIATRALIRKILREVETSIEIQESSDAVSVSSLALFMPGASFRRA